MKRFLLAGLVAAGIAGINLLAYIRARRAEAAYPPEGAFLTVEGVRLHYIRRGPTGQQPVVLLHGSDGFLQDFPASLVDLLARAHDVIAFDRPGHGYSEAPHHEAATPLLQAHLLRGALDQLRVERPLLVGHSWSGMLLMALALERPERYAGLVLISGWVYAPDMPPSLTLSILQVPLLGSLLASTLLTPLKSVLIRRNLARAFAPAPVPADYLRMACALWQRWPWQTVVFAQENGRARALMRTLQYRYSRLSIPVEIVTGDADEDVDPAQHAYRLHQELFESELTIVPHAGHELPQTHPQEIIKAIERGWERASNRTVPQKPVLVDPHKAPLSHADACRRARELVFRYGWNPMAYQILTPGIHYWFTPDGEGVVGYVTRNRVRVVAGAPLCVETRLLDVSLAFEQEATAQGERVCWFGLTTRLESLLTSLPSHSLFAIGAQPIWDPRNWPTILKQNASLRAQLNRARNKGVSVSEWSVEHANANPDLQRCLEEWLASRALPTLHFLTEPVDLARLADRRIFVAEVHNIPIGYLIATPIPSRDGWLVEQIVRGKSAPNGAAELLVDAVMRALAADGSRYVTLGLAPLSQRAPAPAQPPPLWLNLLLTWARAHGRRFYNFGGLDAFKAKFKPDAWEPLFAVTNEATFSPGTLTAMAAAFSKGSLGPFVGHTLWSALRQEFFWLQDRARTKQG